AVLGRVCRRGFFAGGLDTRGRSGSCPEKGCLPLAECFNLLLVCCPRLLKRLIRPELFSVLENIFLFLEESFLFFPNLRLDRLDLEFVSLCKKFLLGAFEVIVLGENEY